MDASKDDSSCSSKDTTLLDEFGGLSNVFNSKAQISLGNNNTVLTAIFYDGVGHTRADRFVHYYMGSINALIIH